jgi:hypothetical protein
MGITTITVQVSPASAPAVTEAVSPNQVAPIGGDWLEVTVAGGEAAVPDVVRRLAGAGVAVERLRINPPSLEDVFVALTGTEIETSAGGSDVGKITAVRRGLGVPTGPGR